MANENEECLTLITISYHYTTILIYYFLDWENMITRTCFWKQKGNRFSKKKIEAQ